MSVDTAGGLVDRAPDTAGEIALAAAVVVAGAWLLSIAGSLVIYGGFEIESDGERLRIRRGLVRRRTATVPLDRIHAVRLVEGPLRQPFGLLAVRMEVAGYGSDAGASGTLLPVRAPGRGDRRPGPRRARAGRPGAALRRPPRRALRRYVLPPAAAGAAAGAALAVAAPRAWPAALAARGGGHRGGRARLPRRRLGAARRARRAAPPPPCAHDARRAHGPAPGPARLAHAPAAPRRAGRLRRARGHRREGRRRAPRGPRRRGAVRRAAPATAAAQPAVAR